MKQRVEKWNVEKVEREKERVEEIERRNEKEK